MGARVIQLAEIRARLSQPALQASALESVADYTDRFHFWTGASGRRYVHTIYSLIECPAVPCGNYVLVRREADGTRHVLAIGRVQNEAPSLNLAQLRRQGALVGANEVHVHLLAGTAKQSRMIEIDLRSGQLSRESTEPAAAATHH